MNYVLIFLLPVMIYGSNLGDILKGVDNNLLLKSKQKEIKAYKELYEAQKGKNFITVDAQLSAVRLKDTPSAFFELMPGVKQKVQMGVRDNYSGEIDFSYPIFTGFAITNYIKKAKLQFIKSKLEKKNLQRKLYLKSIVLYSQLFAVNKAIDATKEALKAMELSYKKAKALEENGLLNLSSVYNIESKKYDIIANIKDLKAKKKKLNDALFYISTRSVEGDFSLPDVPKKIDKTNLLKRAFRQREDIKVIEEQLHISQTDINLAKSLYYPKVAFAGAFKREGDSLRLNGDGHTNPDKSFIGLSFKWNLFDGFSKNHTKEAAMSKKAGLVLYLKDYKRSIVREVDDLFADMDALKYRLKAAKKATVAKEEYYRLTKARFENSLASADELSRSIADLAGSKAKVQKIRADIFALHYKMLLETGVRGLKIKN